MSRTVTVDSLPPQPPTKRAWNFIDRTGHRFGKLTALYTAKKPERPKAIYWVCRCDCGKETVVFVGHLTHNHTTSCGCHALQRTSESHYKHGQSGHGSTLKPTPEYRAWNGMKKRCSDPDEPGYKYYGGRGIKVCQRWLDSFQNFFDDMGIRPVGMSLDRIETNGNYEPGNCRWATRYVQSNNRRNNIRVTLDGRTQNVSQWCVEFGIDATTVYNRVKRSGWTYEEALLNPAGKPGRRKGTKNGRANQQV